MGERRTADDLTAEAQAQDLARFGWLAFLAAGASMTACYVATLVPLFAPALGSGTFELNPHVQAVLMWGFALVAVVALARDRRRHGRSHPLALGAAAFVVILGTLYTHYDARLETLGYVALVAAAFLNQHAILSRLNATVRAQAQTLAEVNESLEQRVSSQVDEIERLARLKRFLAPEIAELITSEGKEAVLNSHRGFIACLFCDIRNFTSLSEDIEPEEVMEVLQQYHRTLGRLVGEHGGTVGYRAGDGLMVILNDPVPADDPAGKGIALAKDMMAAFEEARPGWRKLGHEIGFGIGLASGYATLGLIGDEGRLDYTAIGNVVNLAARLCDQADDGEILLNRRVFADIGDSGGATSVGTLELKGFKQPVKVFRLIPAGDAADNAGVPPGEDAH